RRITGTPPFATAPALAAAFARLARGNRCVRVVLNIRPPLAEFGFDFTRLGAQQQEIIGSAKARMRHEPLRLLAAPLVESWLQLPDFAHGLGKALGNGHA